MKKYALILIALMLFISCNIDSESSDLRLSDKEYYYYSGGGKIYFKLSLSEVYIAFEQDSISFNTVDSILNNYEFLDYNEALFARYLDGFRVNINETCNDSVFQEHLRELNNNNKISSATPVFYFSEDDPNSYCILVSEVLTKYNEDNISESEFINYAESLNLELISSVYRQHFKVKEIITGFEALEIANNIYESIKSEWSHPNFIGHIGFE